MIRAPAAGILLLAASCAHSPAPAARPPLPDVGFETPTDRAATVRNAIAIHDGVLQQAVGSSPAGSWPSPPTPPIVDPAWAGKVHSFWIWTARLCACLGALLVAALCVVTRPPSKGLLPVAAAVSILSLIDVGLSLANSQHARSASAERLIRAEWRWKIDLARASTMTDEAAGRASLDAAQRYAAAVAPR